MAVHQANTGAENQKFGVCSAHDTESVTNQHGHLSCTVQSMFVPFASWYATESGLVPQPPRNEDVIDLYCHIVIKKTVPGSERFPEPVTPLLVPSPAYKQRPSKHKGKNAKPY